MACWHRPSAIILFLIHTAWLVYSVTAAEPAKVSGANAADSVQAGTSSSSFCFISHGCWGGNDVPSQRAVAAVMGKVAAERNVRFVIAAGDNFYTRGVKSVDDSRFQTTFERVYNAPSLQAIPFLVALGNHDYRGNFWAQVNYTQLSRRWYLPHPFYERRFPDASLTVIVMDCPLLERCFANRGKERWQQRCWDREAQHEWFRTALRQAKADGLKWRVVVCHYPMYANGPHINHQWLIDLVEPAMKANGAQLYINADNHYMQVSHHDGVAYFNSGGGAGLQPHKPTDRGYRKNAANTFEALSMGVGLHCVETTAAGEVLRTRLIDSHGTELFQFDLSPAEAAKKQEVSMARRTAAEVDAGVHKPDATVSVAVKHPPLVADEMGTGIHTNRYAAFLLVVVMLGLCVARFRRLDAASGRVKAHA
jgi:tartrate-resistant acid phosphatase type 5